MKRILLLISALALLKLLIQVIHHYVIFSEDVYYQTFGDIYSIPELTSLIQKRRDNIAFNYAFQIAGILIRISCVSFALYAGIYLADINESLATMFKVVLATEIAFCLKPLLTILYFLVADTSYTITEFYTFNPLSLQSIIAPPDGTYPELKFLLNVCNVFLVFYFIILSLELSRFIDISLIRALKIVLASYGSLYILWITFIMFLITSLK